MFSRFVGWLFSVVFAFSLGAGLTREPASDSELQQKVQDHMDVIVDESAAIVDDVMDEIRQDEHYQEAEQFASDVQEIIDNTRNDIQEHFCEEETESVTEGGPGWGAAVEEEEEAAGEAPEEAVTEAAETEIAG